MTDRENFLSRWSRRKSADVENKSATRDGLEPQSTVGDEAANRSAEAAEPERKDFHQNETVEAEFDLKSLPAIDSIQAGTDVSVFLRAGVPAELARAALRRAWAADPAVRNFIGLSENSWDFTAPGGVPGFGPLSPEDAGQLMARYAGKLHEAVRDGAEKLQRVGARLEDTRSDFERSAMPADVPSIPEGRAPEVKSPVAQHETNAVLSGVDASLLQRDSDHAAVQKIESKNSNDSTPGRRSHGSALPTLPE